MPSSDPAGTKSTNIAHGRARRSAAPRRMAVLGATLLGAAAFAAPAHAGIGLHAPISAAANDPFGQFPAWYQDDEGQQVALCLDPADGACGAVGDGLPNPAGAVVFDANVPANNNFPDEAFYQRAIGTVGANIQLTLAQEATYGGEDGTQAVFGRVRIRDLDNELTPGEWYRFTQPGGQVDLQAPVNFSSDIGCLAACDDAGFTTAGASDLAPTFLQKDRRVGAPPAGYLADAGGVQAMVGSSFVPPGETQPANFFRVQHITGDGGAVTGLVGQSNVFEMLVPGKLAPGSAPAGIMVNSSGQLGSQRVAAASTGKTVTLTNAGSGALQITGLAVAGADAGQFAVTSAPCATTLAAGASCTMPVTFTPNGSGARSAQINVTHATTAGPVVKSVPLLGTGVQPILTLPAPLAFGSQNVGALTGPRVIAVRNTGTDTMHVNSATLGGTDAADYSFGNNACNNANVAAGAQCTVEVFFTPQAAGARSAALNISSDAGAGSLPITGSGVAGPGAAAGAAAGTPAAANTGQSAATATALKLKSLGGPTRIKRSKARQSGIRLSMRLPDGAKVVRIKIYRKTSSGLKLLTTTFKSPLGTTGVYHVTQSQSALRKAFKRLGNYQAEVTPGTSKTALGTASRLSFKIVR